MSSLENISLIKKAFGEKRARWAWRGAECVILVFLLKMFIAFGAGAPEKAALFFHPTPDAAEYAWASRAFAKGENPLLPIVNELHPSRYSPIHPFLLSLWIRINGGRPEAIHGWGLFAVILGIAGLYILAIQIRLPRLYRILFVYLLTFTPFLISQTRGLMQEPTIFLFFSWGVLAWHNGMKGGLYNDDLNKALIKGQKWRELGLFLAAGLLLGAIGCVRLTVFPLIFFLLIAMIPLKRGSGSWKRIGAFLLGVGIVVLVSASYLYRIAGVPFVSAYHHWMPGVKYFEWKNAFTEPPNYKIGLPHYLIIAQDLFSVRKTGFLFGWRSPALLILGGFLLVFFFKKKEREQGTNAVSLPVFLFLLFLFALSQIVIHLFYNFYDLRFFILVYPIIVLSGLGGWRLVIKKIYGRSSPRRAYAILLAAVILAMIAGIGEIKQVWESLTTAARKRGDLKPFREEIQIHKRYGELMIGLSRPLFLDSLAVLNGRLLLGLYEYRFPIAPIEKKSRFFRDGHTIQFLWYNVKPPVGYVDPTFRFPGNPYESFLFDMDKGYFNEKLFESLIAHYGGIGIYYPTRREKDLTPLLELIQKKNCEIIDASLDAPWKLKIIQPF